METIPALTLCEGESTSHGWIPLAKGQSMSMRGCDVFFDVSLEILFSKKSESQVILWRLI